MTVGQRIAQKRKELGLSQEALGEQLGVSRQAIYKWESDATLPEIEKLVALSRIFGVPVGWLLGVEDAPNVASGDLTETQLQIVKEIVDGYLAAQPKPEASKRRRWPWVIAIAACLAIIIALFSLSEQLRSLDNQTHYLQSTMQMIENSVANQIGSITGRVEEILKSQNALTADYSTQVTSIDEAGTMATFSFRVVPKTYQEGTVAWVDIVNEDFRITFGPYSADREVFSGEVTVALSDYTALYIVFEHNGIRQTQLLDTYQNLYTRSFPSVYLDVHLTRRNIDNETNTFIMPLEGAVTALPGEGGFQDLQTIGVSSYRLGLFADQELVAWFSPDTRTVRHINSDGTLTLVEQEYLKLAPDGIVLDRDKVYCIAAVVVDQYGREFVQMDGPISWSGVDWTSAGSYTSGPHFEGWTY